MATQYMIFCECGDRLRVQDWHFGWEVRCVHCLHIFSVTPEIATPLTKDFNWGFVPMPDAVRQLEEKSAFSPPPKQDVGSQYDPSTISPSLPSTTQPVVGNIVQCVSCGRPLHAYSIERGRTRLHHDQVLVCDGCESANCITCARATATSRRLDGYACAQCGHFPMTAKRSPDSSSIIGGSSPVVPEPLPESGWVEYYSIGHARAKAPFEIVTRRGEASHYYVKLTDLSGRVDVLGVFVRAGGRASVLVPFGDYLVKYAIGDVWYGTLHLFGAETLYAQADRTFHFGPVTGGAVGCRIELIRRVHGNLQFSPLRREDF